MSVLSWWFGVPYVVGFAVMAVCIWRMDDTPPPSPYCVLCGRRGGLDHHRTCMACAVEVAIFSADWDESAELLRDQVLDGR